MTTKNELRDIDRIVDTVVKDDGLATNLKRKLHDRLETSQASEMKVSTTASRDDSAEDMWDNLPV